MTYSERLHRPKYHYTVKKGYMNDPNGLIYNSEDGVFHLFYQYNSEITTDEYFGSWVSKSWGHAISSDLVNWAEQEVAFQKDKQGLIWSGSSAIDRENTSGLFNCSSGRNIVSVYSNASQYEILHPVYKSKIRVCLGYSPDGGNTFKKIEEPIIKNENNRYDEAFGDPKLFWYEEEKKWVLITALRIRIFSSKNLIDWTLEDEPLVNGEPFGAECPDFFPYLINGEKKWIFSGAGKYYIVGSFGRNKNGKLSFIPESGILTRDNGNMYATQHFNDFGDRIIQMSWMVDHSSLDFWRDGKNWDGAQSLPLEFKLKYDGVKYKIYTYPADEILKIRKTKIFEKKDIQISSVNILDGIHSKNFDFESELDISKCVSFEIKLRKDEREETYIGYSKEKGEIIFSTYNSGPVYHNYYHISVTDDKFLKLRIISDGSVMDVFVNDGESCRSQFIFPSEFSDKMSFSAVGSLIAKNLNIYNI